MSKQNKIENACFQFARTTAENGLNYLISTAEEQGNEEALKHLKEARKFFYRGVEHSYYQNNESTEKLASAIKSAKAFQKAFKKNFKNKE